MSFFSDVTKGIGEFLNSDEVKHGLSVAVSTIRGHDLAEMPFDKAVRKLNGETMFFEEDEFQAYKKQILESFRLVLDPQLQMRTYELYGMLLFIEMRRFNYRSPRPLDALEEPES